MEDEHLSRFLHRICRRTLRDRRRPLRYAQVMQTIGHPLHILFPKNHTAQVGHAQHRTYRAGYALEMARCEPRERLARAGHLHLADHMDELARVDAHRTGSGAQSVSRAQVLADTAESTAQFACLVAIALFRQTCYFTLNNNTLARRQSHCFAALGKPASHTIDFAETALDAAVHQRMHLRQGFDMLDIRCRVFVEDHAGIEDVLRVEQRLHVLHQLVGIVSPLSSDKRRHVAACAMLGFE